MQSLGSEAITHNGVSNYRNTVRASVPINREGLFISLDEAASQLGLDEACILAMVKKGLLTFCNVGERLVFFRSQFNLLLQQFLNDEATVLDSYSPPQSILVSDKGSNIHERYIAHNLETNKTVEFSFSHQQFKDGTESVNAPVASQVKNQQDGQKLASRNPVVEFEDSHPQSNCSVNRHSKIAELKGSIQHSDIRVESRSEVVQPKDHTRPSSNEIARRREAVEPLSRIQPSSHGMVRRSEAVEPLSGIQPSSNEMARRSEVVEPKGRFQPSSNGLARHRAVAEPKVRIQPSSNGLARHRAVAEPKVRIQPSSNELAMRREVVEPKGRIQPSSNEMMATRSEAVKSLGPIQPSSNGMARHIEVVKPLGRIQPSSNRIANASEMVEPMGSIKPSSFEIESPNKLVNSEVSDQQSSAVMENAESLKRFILSLPQGTHSVPGVKYLRIRKGKGVTTIELVVKSNPKKILEKYKHSEALDNLIFENILTRYNFFLEQYRSGRLFAQINWTPHNNKVRIRTMRQLLEFHLNNYQWGTRETKMKLERMINRYCLGKNGDVDLRYASNEELMAIFINKAAKGNAPSDRDELLKRIKAAYNFAKNHQNVEKLEFFMPLEVVKRNRGTPKTTPSLNVYIQFFTKAVELQKFDLATFMLCQETIFTRMQNTIELCKSDFKFEDCSVRIPGHKHKNGKNGVYYFPPGLINLFKDIIAYRIKRTQSTNPCLFPSLKNTSKFKANFCKEIALVRKAIVSDLTQSHGDEFCEEVREVNAFAFHDLRGLNISLLKQINVREGEANNAFNRYVGAVELAYDDLTDRNQRMFKNEKLKYISENYPEYSRAIKSLHAHYSSDGHSTAA